MQIWITRDQPFQNGTAWYSMWTKFPKWRPAEQRREGPPETEFRLSDKIAEAIVGRDMEPGEILQIDYEPHDA